MPFLKLCWWYRCSVRLKICVKHPYRYRYCCFLQQHPRLKQCILLQANFLWLILSLIVAAPYGEFFCHSVHVLYESKVMDVCLFDIVVVYYCSTCIVLPRVTGQWALWWERLTFQLHRTNHFCLQNNVCRTKGRCKEWETIYPVLVDINQIEGGVYPSGQRCW